jgi:hypothetical protein
MSDRIKVFIKRYEWEKFRWVSLHYSPTGKNLIVRTSQKTDCFSARSLDELLAKAFEDFPKSS